MKLFRSSLLLVFISSTCEGVTSIEPRVEIGLVDVPEPITCVFLPDPVLIYKPEDLIDSMYTEISVFDFEGVLAVQFMIDEAGKVQSPEIVRGFKPINKRLLEIASHFVFEPAQQNGIPVPVSYLYPFRITFDK